MEVAERSKFISRKWQHLFSHIVIFFVLISIFSGASGFLISSTKSQVTSGSVISDKRTISQRSSLLVVSSIGGYDDDWEREEDEEWNPEYSWLKQAKEAPSSGALEGGKKKEGWWYDALEDDGSGMSDDEKLDRFREQRLKSNDQWQFNTFASKCLGDWYGMWEEYDWQSEEGTGGLKLCGQHQIISRAEAPVAGLKEEEEEEEDSAPPERRILLSQAVPEGAEEGHVAEGARSPLRDNLIPSDFRGERGNMVNANSYALTKTTAESVIMEIGLRHEDCRMRARIVYGKQDKSQVYSLNKLFLCREQLGNFPSPGQEPLFGNPGNGLYETPPFSALNYMNFDFEGHMSLRFPWMVDPSNLSSGAISMDWTPSSSERFQVDRYFKTFDGSLSSFELTETRP